MSGQAKSFISPGVARGDSHTGVIEPVPVPGEVQPAPCPGEQAKPRTLAPLMVIMVTTSQLEQSGDNVGELLVTILGLNLLGPGVIADNPVMASFVNVAPSAPQLS